MLREIISWRSETLGLVTFIVIINEFVDQNFVFNLYLPYMIVV